MSGIPRPTPAARAKPAAASRAPRQAAAATVSASAAGRPTSNHRNVTAATSSMGSARAASRPSSALASDRPSSRRIQRASSASSATAAAAAESAAGSLSPPPIPLHIAADPLSRTTTPLLYWIASCLTFSEVHCFARANRLLYTATIAADIVWKQRWAKAQASGLGANPTNPSAAAAAPAARRGAPAMRGRAASAGSAAPPRKSTPTTASSASASALAHYSRDLTQQTRVPASLPASSLYRWALLSVLRADHSARFGKWATQRSHLLQHTLVNKPVAEHLGIKVQLKLQLHQRPQRTPTMPCVLFDNTLSVSWRAEAGVLLRDLRSVQLIGHSSKLMLSLPLGGDMSTASSITREWVVIRQAQNDQSLSLLEWRVRGTGDQRRKATAPPVSQEDSPFVPNLASRDRAAASLAVSSASGRSASARAHPGTLPIPGLHLTVLAGTWGRWDGSSRSPVELAFLWISLPYPLLLAHLPVPTLPAIMRQPRWQVMPDDLDSALGLHGLRVNVAFRNLRRTLFSWFYSDLTASVQRDAPAPSGADAVGAVVLHLPSLKNIAPQWSELPSITWRGELWSGKFDGLCLMDLCVAVEDRVLWLVTQPVPLEALSNAAASASAALSMDEPSVRHFAGVFQDVGIGSLRFELSHSPAVHASADGRRVEVTGSSATAAAAAAPGGEGITRLQSLRVALDLPFFDERFGSVYARAGSASLGHALQSRAAHEMSPQEYAQFQRDQMRLRDDPMERPLGPASNRRGSAGRGGGGPAPHFAPNFAIHAPAAAAAAAPAAAAAASPHARQSAARRGRPEWQDTAPPKDDDEGFKF